MTECERRAARLGDERFEILDLALDRIRRGVAALASTTTVVGDDAELWRERLGQWRAWNPVQSRTM